MKKNNLNLILLIGVTLVWGFVIYQVFADDSDSENFVNSSVSVKNPKKILATTDFELNKKYRDPFGSEIKKEKAKASVRKENNRTTVNKHSAVTTVINKPMDLSFIKYHGLIKNKKSNKEIALVTLNGNQKMISEGDLVNEIKFKKNFKDSIIIEINDNQYTISR